MYVVLMIIKSPVEIPDTSKVAVVELSLTETIANRFVSLVQGWSAKETVLLSKSTFFDIAEFYGDYLNFSHVSAHELNHNFISQMALDHKIQYDLKENPLKFDAEGYCVPLWFVEGNAEYFSIPWRDEDDVHMRDIMINRKLFSAYQVFDMMGDMTMSDFKSYVHTYKIGQHRIFLTYSLL